MTKAETSPVTAAAAEPPSDLDDAEDFVYAPTPLFNITQQISLQLAKEILAGEIPEGSKLSEVQLAKRFRVSRGPIRDAVGILERNFFVRWPPRLSARVNSTSRDDIEQSFRVRAGILGLAAWYAAQNATEEEIVNIRQGVDHLEQFNKRHPDDIEGFYARSRSVWGILVKSSHAKTIWQTVQMIADSPIWHFAVHDKILDSGSTFSGTSVVVFWRDVSESIVRRDADAARGAAENILMTTWTFIAETFPTNADHRDR